MSLTQIGEKIMDSQVAHSRKEYQDQIDSFYSYCRWIQIIQKLAKPKNDRIAALLRRMGLFLNVYSISHMDDHMVDFLGRTDPDVLQEIRLFAALDQHDLNTFRTGWVRFLPPSGGLGNGKEITIPEGTVVHPAGNSEYALQTAIPWVMNEGDTKIKPPGVIIPVRTVSSTHADNLPADQNLVLASPIAGIERATNPAEIRKRSYQNHDLRRILREAYGPHFDTQFVQDEKNKIEKEGLQNAHLTRAWMERHTSPAWTYSLAAGELAEGLVMVSVVSRLVNYADILASSQGKIASLRKFGRLGGFRTTVGNLLRLPGEVVASPVRLLYEPYKQYRMSAGKEVRLSLRQRFKNHWGFREGNNARRVEQWKGLWEKGKNAKNRIKNRFRGEIDNAELRDPLLDEDISPPMDEFQEDAWARSLEEEDGLGQLARRRSIKMDAVGINDVQEFVLDEDLAANMDLLPDDAAENIRSARRLVVEDGDPQIVEEARLRPGNRVIVDDLIDPDMVADAGADAKVVQIEPNEDLPVIDEKPKNPVKPGESALGDLGGVVFFIGVDILMGVAESYKRKEMWEQARDAVKTHKNLVGGVLREHIEGYLKDMKTYRAAIADWNEMLTKYFVNPKTGKVETYPSLLPVSTGETHADWFNNYVPVPTEVLESDEFLRLLVEDGLPEEIKDISDPDHFKSELDNPEHVRRVDTPNLKWDIHVSHITWQDLQKIRVPSASVSIDPKRFDSAGTSDTEISNPLGVYDHWSERYLSNQALILSFRNELINAVTNKHRDAAQDWPKKVDEFTDHMEKTIGLLASMSSREEIMKNFAAYAAAHPGAPPDSWKDGTTDQKFDFYQYLYGYLADKEIGRGIGKEFLGEVPSKDVSKHELQETLDSHIRTFASEKARAGQVEEYISELKHLMARFSLYSDLMVACQMTPYVATDDAPDEPADTTKTEPADTSQPPADTSQPPADTTPEPTGRRLGFYDLRDMAQFIQEMMAFTDDEWANQTKNLDSILRCYFGGVQHVVDHDFPIRLANRFRAESYWRGYEAPPLFYLPKLVSIMRRERRWRDVIKLASPSVREALDRLHERLEAARIPVVTTALVEGVIDALFDFCQSFDREMSNTRSPDTRHGFGNLIQSMNPR